MLVTSVDDLRLRMLGNGSLFPWLGPALRGALAMTLKNMECRHPPADRDTRYRYCAGCGFHAECGYGPLYEPAAPAAGTVPRGHENVARPLAVAPYYPCPDPVEVGTEIPVRVQVIGEPAQARLDTLLAALERTGRLAGLGPYRLRFELTGSASRTVFALRPSDLPADPAAVPQRYPRVGVGLTAPLVVMSRDPDGRRRLRPRGQDTAADTAQPDSWRRTERRYNVRPTFADLFQISWRLLAELFGRDGERLPPNYLDWMDRATHVAMVDHCFEPFRQERWSGRREERYPVHGVVGGGVYADVPGAFLPYLYWAGQLHAGTHRIAGAGSWRIILD
jgi:hypothetical protein